MPDQNETSVQPTEPLTPGSQPTQQPNAEARAALYEKVYNSQQEPITQPTAAAAQAEPDYKALFNSLATEVATLKQQLASAPTAQTTATPAAPAADWFELLQSGKRTEAEAALKSLVAQGASQQIVQETLIQAAELYRTEREIEDFNSSVRASNPDMLDAEDLIALKAEQKFRPYQANIKTSKDYIDTYKRVVNEATEDIRKLLQRTRAAAKNEAMTTRREVLASTTMQPNNFNRREEPGQGNQPAAEIDTSPQSYFEARQAAYRKNAGM